MVRLLNKAGRALHPALLPPSDPASHWHQGGPGAGARPARRERRNKRREPRHTGECVKHLRHRVCLG